MPSGSGTSPPCLPQIGATLPASPSRPQETAQLLAAARLVAAVRGDAQAEALFALFHNAPELDVCPIVSRDDMPLGLVHERSLRTYAYSHFGRALLQNRALHICASHFAQPCPVVEADAGIDQVLGAFAEAPQSPGVILTRGRRYAGVLSAGALLSVLHERRLRQARDQSPLTGLPGNRSIVACVESLARAAPHARFLCYFDLDNFKAFNDAYGFRRGDRAIVLLARMLRHALPAQDRFVGHIGGDDFFMGLRAIDPDLLRSRLGDLLLGFASAAAMLHDASDRTVGKLVAHDRDGMPRAFPLLRCSAAVLELPPGTQGADADTLGGLVSGLKAAAKAGTTKLAWRRYEPSPGAARAELALGSLSRVAQLM